MAATALSAATAPGEPVGSAFRLSSLPEYNQTGPSAAMGPAGSFVVAWASEVVGGIRARRYSSAGVPLGGEIRVDDATPGSSPSVATDADGNFTVAWSFFGPNNGANAGIYAQRFAADGTKVGGQFRVNTTTDLSVRAPAVAMDADGDAVIVWQGADEAGSAYFPGSAGIYAQRYAADGTPLGGEFRVNVSVARNQEQPSIASDPHGNFVVAWSSYHLDGYGDVFARRYAVDGTALGGEFRVNENWNLQQLVPSVGSDALGNFAVAWKNLAQGGSGPGIYLRLYSADGTPRTGEARISGSTANSIDPAVAMDADGDLAVTWKTLANSVYRLDAQLFDAMGAPRSPVFQVDSAASTSLRNDSQQPAVACDADGDIAIAWPGKAAGDAKAAVYARRYAGPEPVDLSITLIESEEPVAEFGSFSYQAIVSNRHPVEAPTGIPAIDSAIGTSNTIRVAGTLSPELAFGDASGSDWACSHDAGIVTCDYAGSLLPMTTTAVTIDVTAPGGETSVTSSAGLTAAQYDADASNDSDSESTSICVNSGTLSLPAGPFAVAEGGTVTIQVTRSEGYCRAVSVAYATSDGTAIEGADYAAASGVLSWAPGEGGSKAFVLHALQDSLDENAEILNVALGAATGGASIGTPASAAVQIADDDPTPTVTISTVDASAVEGAAVVVVAELSAPSGRVITLPFTLGGTASNGADYTATPGPVTIPAGATSAALVTIDVADDALDEDAETVEVALGTPTNADLGADTSFVLGIGDNDLPPQISVVTPDATEQEASAGSNGVMVQLSAPSGRPITVSFGVSGSASQGVDYTISTSPTVIAPGATTATLATITVQDDGLDEADETIVVTLGDVVNAGAGTDTHHSLTIADDDAPPTVSFTSVAQTINEGGGTATITARLSTASSKTVRVHLTLGGSATHPADFGVSAQEIVIPAGTSSGSVTVTVVDDAKIELTENARFTIGSAVNATAGAFTTHTLTIKDNDPVTLP